MIIDNWSMTYETYKDLPCTVPCSMYSVLLAHGLMEDPFYGLNEKNCTALSDKDCSFSARFSVTEEDLSKAHTELTFSGLDTICEIRLNDKKLATTKNMHRAYVYDVKKYLIPGENRLDLFFSSPTQYMQKLHARYQLPINLGNMAGTSHLRKSLCMSGWDWGPQLPDMGIFRPVSLDCYDGDKIESIHVLQHHKENKVLLDISVETRHQTADEIRVSIDGQEIRLTHAKGTVTIENPRLWWVRGYGEPYLYDITATLSEQGKTTDTKTQKIGLRTLTVSLAQDEDKSGNEFCFVINDVKIFAMGANYIPPDSILSRITKERTHQVLQSAMDANYNCIRVWGGGYYPDDYFYELCDEHGILIWQDMMVACAIILLRKELKEELVQEAIYNIKRIRHHASLGLICGNNEMEEATMCWDGCRDNQRIREDYIELYERIFPEISEELAPDIFYWQSSPSSGGGFCDPTCNTKGDVHFWRVWHGGVPFTEYRNHHFRFCSEYGFESYPAMRTIRSFCEEKDMNCFSRVMENHQKFPEGNSKILSYLADNYLYPNSFETLVYASQLLQADAIKYGVEHFRRDRGYCMGSLYWQMNDCWPVASWSSVDYFGRYKALHYAAKKFYSPISMGLFIERNTLTVNISNETMQNFKGSVKLHRMTAGLEEKQCSTHEISVDSLTAKDVFTLSVESENPYKEFLFADLYDENGTFIMRQTELFVKPKHFSWLAPHITWTANQTKDGVEIFVSSDVFAKGVYIELAEDINLSDNFFDITDNKPYRIFAKTTLSPEALMQNVSIKSVYDIGK